MYCKVEK